MNNRLLYLSGASLAAVLLVELCVHSYLDHATRTRSMRLHVIFFLQLFGLLCSRYVWNRLGPLFGSTTRLFSVSFLCKAALLLLIVLSMLTWPLALFFIQTNPPLVNTVCSTCYGVAIFLLTGVVVADICSFLVRWVLCRPFPSCRLSHSAEGKIRGLLAIFFAAGLIYTGRVSLSNGTMIERVGIPIPGLDPSLNGTTIVHLSDLHLGAFNGRDTLQSVVDKVNGLRGDVVVITGDLVDGSVRSLIGAIPPLAELRSKHGVFYTTG